MDAILLQSGDAETPARRDYLTQPGEAGVLRGAPLITGENLLDDDRNLEDPKEMMKSGSPTVRPLAAQ